MRRLTPSGIAADVDAVDRRAAGRRREQAAEHADRRGLAGAVAAEESEDLAATDVELTSSTALNCAERARQTVDVDRRRRRSSTRPPTARDQPRFAQPERGRQARALELGFEQGQLRVEHLGAGRDAGRESAPRPPAAPPWPRPPPRPTRRARRGRTRDRAAAAGLRTRPGLEVLRAGRRARRPARALAARSALALPLSNSGQVSCTPRSHDVCHRSVGGTKRMFGRAGSTAARPASYGLAASPAPPRRSAQGGLPFGQRRPLGTALRSRARPGLRRTRREIGRERHRRSTAVSGVDRPARVRADEPREIGIGERGVVAGLDQPDRLPRALRLRRQQIVRRQQPGVHARLDIADVRVRALASDCSNTRTASRAVTSASRRVRRRAGRSSSTVDAIGAGGADVRARGIDVALHAAGRDRSARSLPRAPVVRRDVRETGCASRRRCPERRTRRRDWSADT